MSIQDTLRRWAGEDTLVAQAAQQHNTRVLRIVVWVMVAINLVHVLVFSRLGFDDPVRSDWAHNIAWAHGLMAVLMLAVGVAARHARRRAKPQPLLRWLPEAACLLVLAFSVVLTVMDQAISSSINAYINAAVGVSIVFLLRPRSVVVLLALGWCALAWALGLSTDNAALLTTNRMNAASASALAVLVSVLLWRRYAQTELLQRALAHTNEQLEEQRAELLTLATRDPLTGLFNRREFVLQAELALALAQRQGTPLALLMIDLDHFKTINDRFGHPAGDEVLRQVAAVMLQSLRQTDMVARFGGEEFVVLLPDTTADNAMLLAEKLRLKLGHTPVPAGCAPVTASIGLTCRPASQGTPLDALLIQADRAMYQAKNRGRNQTVLATDAPPIA